MSRKHLKIALALECLVRFLYILLNGPTKISSYILVLLYGRQILKSMLKFSFVYLYFDLKACIEFVPGLS